MRNGRPSAAPGTFVAVAYGVPRAGVPAATSFRRWIVATLSGAKYRHAAEVSIRIVSEQEGRDLNRHYRHKDYATNVLSFPADLPSDAGVSLLGDIAVCAPVVLREAREQGKPVRAHYAHLTVHGMLHLLGMDHQTDDDAERMEALETRILAALGIPDPYR